MKLVKIGDCNWVNLDHVVTIRIDDIARTVEFRPSGAILGTTAPLVAKGEYAALLIPKLRGGAF